MKRCLTVLVFTLLVSTASAREFLVYFGTYTGPKSEGIYVSRFDSDTGELSTPELACAVQNPSFLALGHDENRLYSAGELSSGGAVTAFSINRENGRLTQINQQPSGGSGPCHLAPDITGRCLLVANYGSGSIAALRVKPDGSLGVPASVIQHQGSSVNTNRQAGPHAHFICPSPDDRFVLTCDLGLDQILLYRLDAGTATLIPANPPFVSVKPGSGPRHLVFSGSGKFVYVINEMGGTITVFDFDAKAGTMREVQTLSTLPPDFSGPNTAAEIALHPSGRFLYASNRGFDSIAVFKVDSATGKLTFVAHETTDLHTPRHFAIDPTGKWLLAENQNSDSVIVFAIDPETGTLQPTGRSVKVGSPVCAVFLSL